MAQNNKNYYIVTYGCQMNEHDTEKLAGMLTEMGYRSTDEPGKADIILLNTCMIRENAELKLYGKVGSLQQYKRKNPDLIIGVGGCMMQSEETAERLAEKHSHVDLIFGTHNIHRLPELIRQAEKKRIFEVWDNDRGLIPDLPVQRKNDYSAWVSIIKGCENYCSYCIVPYVRGTERSRSPEDIIKEVTELGREGVKEVTLLGQNVNSYGRDLDQDIDFADLLTELDEIKGISRIRYMTSHPRDFTDKLIRVIRDSNNICEHFHLPVQSGSDAILRKMNRGYTGGEYRELIKKIRAEICGASITTDIIVGFPGETAGDFRETLTLVRETGFDMAFTFSYSPRPGTKAARMDNQIPGEEKSRRLQQLMEVQNKISKEKNRELVGKTVKVLVEGESKNNPETLSGRTRTNKLVIIPRDKGLTGEIIRVRIKEARSWTLYGEVV